ncbi:uncharacterized protein LOC143885927 [Tasmannia lanceolata]|uniref:uncharacterized protein LOC143885927 n=1 Tax=Tasmannia lanceolata TaxID=3420 RepID=UPI004064BC2A
MTLEDFFTLTEMKDGFTTLARVEELVAVMQKEKDFVSKNVGDTARQWSSVAGILAATENKDCLIHFIRLEGLWFVNQWLQEAQKCTDDDNNFVEESINSLLGALEKLPVSYEQSIAAGIGVTVKQLCSHRSSKVQEKAKTLYDSWNQVKDKDTDCQDVEKGRAFCGEEPKSADVDTTTEGDRDLSPSKTNCDGTSHVESARGSVVSQIEVKDVKKSSPTQDVPPATSNPADVNGIPEDLSSLCSSLVSNTSQESSSVTEKALRCPEGEGITSTGTHGSPSPSNRNVDDRLSDVSKLKDATNETKEIETEMGMNKNSLCKFSKNENCIVSPTGLEKLVPIDAKEGESCPRRTVSDFSCETGDCYPKVSLDVANNGCILGKPESPEASFLRKEPFGTCSNFKESVTISNLNGNRGDDPVISRDLDERDRRSEMEIDYGVDDALEVARQVAKEVEREVVDYREPLCSSSSDKNSEHEIMQSGSPDSVEDEQGEAMMEHPNENELPTEQDFPDGGSAKVKRLKISNIDIESQDGMQDVDSSELAKFARESTGNIEKERCDFDLNDVYAEEIESPIPALNQPITLSTPIPVVAISKGAPGLPVTPLHFEGELGWRGSARTSAFRPASPRRTLDGEASSHSSKSKQNFLKFDLNVADGDNDAAIDLVSTKQVPVSSGLPSGDSSLEVSSRRAERLKLDLNRLSDNDDTYPFPLLDQRVDGQFHHLQNGNRSPSPALSSSSRHPSMINIDLNDNPSFLDTRDSHGRQSMLDKSSSQDKITYRSLKLDDPGVLIMGSRMDVDRKEFVNRTRSFLPNGPSMDSAMSANLVRVESGAGARPVLAYAPAPLAGYGYNGLAMGPTMSLPPDMYGPNSVPYMVDSRGATVIPQILGSSSTAPPSFSRPSFLMSVMGAPSGGVPRSGFDLNSGIPSMEGESREMGSFRQLFVHGQNSLMEEQMKSTGMTLKRKEPECGWELNMLGYKQETSWH